MATFWTELFFIVEACIFVFWIALESSGLSAHFFQSGCHSHLPIATSNQPQPSTNRAKWLFGDGNSASQILMAHVCKSSRLLRNSFVIQSEHVYLVASLWVWLSNSVAPFAIFFQRCRRLRQSHGQNRQFCANKQNWEMDAVEPWPNGFETGGQKRSTVDNSPPRPN